MSAEPYHWVHGVLSRPRFTRYLRVAGGDAEAAIRLYWWNIEASSAFYGLLHCLEVNLRNALHDRLVLRFDRPDWWLAGQMI